MSECILSDTSGTRSRSYHECRNASPGLQVVVHDQPGRTRRLGPTRRACRHDPFAQYSTECCYAQLLQQSLLNDRLGAPTGRLLVAYVCSLNLTATTTRSFVLDMKQRLDIGL